jgi:hypothetical protein
MYDSMVFYRSFYEAIKDLEPEMQGHIYSAIFAYGLDGKEPNLSGVEKSIFTLIKPQIDANNRRKENGKKGAKFGELGGRPKEKNPKKTPKKPLKNPKETPNVNVNVNANVNDNVIIKGMFKPPTIEEVEEYCKKRGNNVNAEQFVTYYAENDWYLSNGKKMKSWKSSVITWEQNHQKAAAGTKFASYPQREESGNKLKGFRIEKTNVSAEEIRKRLKAH